MQLAALSNAVCLYNAYFLQMLYVFTLCLGLLTHCLFISNIILPHAQCFESVGFPNSMFTSFFFSMKGLCAIWRSKITDD